MIVFDNITTDMISNKLNTVLTELFIRGKELNISVIFITQSCFAILENIK